MRGKLLSALALALLVLAVPAAGEEGVEPEAIESDIPNVNTEYIEEAETPDGLTVVDTSTLPFDEEVLDEDQHPVYPYWVWETLTAQLFEWAEQYPEITTLYSAGTSHLGFDLWALEIGNFHDLNATPAEDRETVYLDGGHHANEDLGVTLTMLWAEFLIEEYETNETAEWIVDNRETIMVPLVNTDGNHLNQRWNANAVDINRNYPVGWGGTGSSNNGDHALSEPESEAVVDVLDAYEPDYVNSFHTGVELMLYPWGYTDEFPADRQMFDRVCKEIGEHDRDFCGATFDTIYPAAGITIDTAYGDYGSAAFTYEVDDEQNLMASVEDPRERLDRYWDGVEHAFLNVEKYGAYLVVDEIELDGSEAHIKVTNEGYGNLTWAEVEATAGEGQPQTYRIGELLPNETERFTASFEEEDLEEGTIELGLEYPKRHVAQPMAERTLSFATLPDEGVAVPTEELEEDELEALGAEETEDSIPAPASWLAATAAALVALAARRPRRG